MCFYSLKIFRSVNILYSLLFKKHIWLRCESKKIYSEIVFYIGFSNSAGVLINW